MLRKTVTRIGLVLLASGALLVMSGVSRAENQPRSMDVAASKLARQIVDYLKDKNEKRVVVGDFVGKDLVDGQSAKLQKRLADELAKLDGVEVVDNGAFKVEGTVRTKVKDNRSIVVADVNMLDRNQDDVFVFAVNYEAEIGSNPQEVAQIVGVSSFEPAIENNLAADNKALTESIENPTATIAQGQDVLAAASGPEKRYLMEILVRDDPNQPFRPVSLNDVKDQFATAPLALGQEYALRIHNNTEFDAGVTLSIDGLSMFEFSSRKDYKALDRMVIPAKSSGVIKGWHIDNAISRAFEVAALPESEGFKLNVDRNQLGTIAATFVVAWTPDTPAAKVPPLAFAGSRPRGDNLGTKLGRNIATEYTEGRYFFGSRLLGAITVRYSRFEQPVDVPTDAQP